VSNLSQRCEKQHANPSEVTPTPTCPQTRTTWHTSATSLSLSILPTRLALPVPTLSPAARNLRSLLLLARPRPPSRPPPWPPVSPLVMPCQLSPLVTPRQLLLVATLTTPVFHPTLHRPRLPDFPSTLTLHPSSSAAPVPSLASQLLCFSERSDTLGIRLLFPARLCLMAFRFTDINTIGRFCPISPA
jgi:hypothetical protein